MENTKLEISKRKNTTKKALAELESLIEQINKMDLSADVNTVVSETFYAKLEVSNGLFSNDIHYQEWTNTKAVFRIKEGELTLRSVDSCSKEGTRSINTIHDFIQINFAELIRELEYVISEHKVQCEKKDVQIEGFLSFCEAWKNK